FWPEFMPRSQTATTDLIESGKAGRIHKVAVDMIHQWSVSFRVGLHLFPFRIVVERVPILLRFLTARMLQDIDKEVLRIRRIFGHPVTNAVHVVPLENRVGVIAKTIS